MLEIGFGTVLQTPHRDFPQGCPTTCRLCPLTQLECEPVISILSPHWRQGLFFIHTRSCLLYHCHIWRGKHFPSPHKFCEPWKYQYSFWNSNFYKDENDWHPPNSLSVVQWSALLPHSEMVQRSKLASGCFAQRLHVLPVQGFPPTVQRHAC